ncbi:unnamed protein product [Phytophthora lilii]|uniref:Unnamed protein product n=1 Tax=Phytophthora lilii TaxID=2077276 RepID=A0A9W6TIZ9_9STRA|nr:unnamed protein product [Phytophthora lilii]
MLQVTWAQAQAQGSAEGDGEAAGDEPAAEEAEGVVGGQVPAADPAPTPAAPVDAQTDPDAEALVLVTTESPTQPVQTTGEDTVDTTGVLEEEPTLAPDNSNENGPEETEAPTLPSETTTPPTTEPPMTEAPTEPFPQVTELAPTAEATTKPSLRTEDPAVISDAVTNNAAETQAPGYLSQGTNPLLLVVLAGICCIFLLLWGRKRRSGASTSSSTSSTSAKGPKVQYTQVPDEQPFSHSQDDDDEFCDDYEEDTFANDRDNWDDWEGSSTQAQTPQLNPFVAALSPARPTTPRRNSGNASPFISQPLSPPPQQQQQQHVPLQEVAIAGKGDLLPSSVESNSSSDSFEVVTDEAHAPPLSSRGAAAAEAEKESESVDDLFSVPTSAAPVSHPAAAATPSAAAVSALPTPAEASALFAAEMDDELTAVDAADEWGEDDEWVKGI